MTLPTHINHTIRKAAMRIRERFRPVETPPGATFLGGSQVTTFHQRTEDVNNGRSRPNSPCRMVKTWLKPYEVPTSHGTDWYGYPAGYYSVLVEQMVDLQRDKYLRSLQKEVNQKMIGLQERWSSINFFAELGDIGGMIKSLEKYRYVDYQFGFQPFFNDLREISGRLNTSISSINRQLQTYAKPIPMSFSRNFYFGDFRENFGFYGGDAHRITYGGNGRCSFNGTVRIELPIFQRYNVDTMLWLDQIGFHPDLATAWEATPFSWMVDWFLPIGESLTNRSASWLNPDIFLDGSYSTTFTANVESYTNFSNFYGKVTERGHLINEAITTGYIREPLVNSQLTIKQKPIRLSLGLDSIGKIALLSDIFGPTKSRR